VNAEYDYQELYEVLKTTLLRRSLQVHTDTFARPILMKPGPWEGFDLQAIMKPEMVDAPPEGVLELFNGFVLDFLIPSGDRLYDCAATYAEQALVLSPADADMLLPKKGRSPKAIAQAMAVMLWGFYMMGYQIHYGSDWILVHVGGDVIGVAEGRTVSPDGRCCVDFNIAFDWKGFLEQPREAGVVPPIFHPLTRRFGVRRYVSTDDFRDAVATLAWCPRPRLGVFLARQYFPDTDLALYDKIFKVAEDYYAEGLKPVDALRRAVVPMIVGRTKYYYMTRGDAVESCIWDAQDTRIFFERTLNQLGIYPEQ